ncbi:Mth938-like domain-containing protein [Amaricoccus tamworthensis]|uniref:Mth938-like domain-containing protein n=1 Tax=Amaricoccus tamworthensis TaxID=57002 RepID=UPI003C7DC5B9
MQTTEIKFNDRVPVDGYAPGGFRIGGAVHMGPVAVFPEGAVAWTGLPDLTPLIDRAAELDVLLVGLGPDMVEPEPEFLKNRAALEALDVGVEVMNTPSACRTYNILLSEGRRVAVALMPV